MNFADINSILNAAKAKPAESAVTVPEWGGTVRVAAMTVAERAAFDAESIRRRRKKLPLAFAERLVIACVRDDAGKPLLSPEHEKALGDMPTTVLDRVVKVASKVNGFDLDDEDDEGN